jgi:hypothetical protein
MAARRLVIVLLVMLAISTLAAALVPAPRRGEDAGTNRTETGRTSRSKEEERIPRGKLVQRSIDAAAKRPARLRVVVGDQLALLVRSPRADQVEIRTFGLIEPVSPDAPARLDVLVDRAGRFRVLLGEADRTVGTIVAQPGRPRQSAGAMPPGRRASQR